MSTEICRQLTVERAVGSSYEPIKHPAEIADWQEALTRAFNGKPLDLGRTPNGKAVALGYPDGLKYRKFISTEPNIFDGDDSCVSIYGEERVMCRVSKDFPDHRFLIECEEDGDLWRTIYYRGKYCRQTLLYPEIPSRDDQSAWESFEDDNRGDV